MTYEELNKIWADNGKGVRGLAYVYLQGRADLLHELKENNNGKYRDCDKCLNHVSGACSKWECEFESIKCVWEKAAVNDVTIWNYYPSCYGMTDIESIEGFKYCPYCGKEIDLIQRKA